MYLGRIVEVGTTEEIFERAAHPYTRALLAAVPRPDPSVRRARVVLGGDVPSPVRPPAGCHFHPRCPVAEARCRESYPAFVQLGATHRAACHLLDGEPEALAQQQA
jgi:oligopeptide/dipeptide ABC transporter ATP-binding protein